MVVVGALTGLVVLGCANLSQNAAPWAWSRRIPIVVVVGGVLVVRALRRAVIVSPFGLEARHTFTSWRVPWSAVESFSVEASPGELTVLLSDGSTRRARVGSRRNGERDFATVAAGAQRRQRDRPRAHLRPNRPLQLFMLGGMALIVACAVADVGRVERRPRAGVPWHTVEELRDLDRQIATGDGFAVLLFPLVVVAGIGALVRLVAPRRPRPVGLHRSPAGGRRPRCPRHASRWARVAPLTTPRWPSGASSSAAMTACSPLMGRS